jgi:hypothetical protein
MDAIVSSRSFPAWPLLRSVRIAFLGRQDAPQSFSKAVHRAYRIIGGHVWYVRLLAWTTLHGFGSLISKWSEKGGCLSRSAATHCFTAFASLWAMSGGLSARIYDSPQLSWHAGQCSGIRMVSLSCIDTALRHRLQTKRTAFKSFGSRTVNCSAVIAVASFRDAIVESFFQHVSGSSFPVRPV